MLAPSGHLTLNLQWGRQYVESDIWIVRDGDTYRLLHGHLHLISALGRSGEVYVQVKNEGRLKVVRERDGFVVGAGTDQRALRGNWSDSASCRQPKRSDEDTD
jgi:hypothetical protein